MATPAKQQRTGAVADRIRDTWGRFPEDGPHTNWDTLSTTLSTAPDDLQGFQGRLLHLGDSLCRWESVQRWFSGTWLAPLDVVVVALQLLRYSRVSTTY